MTLTARRPASAEALFFDRVETCAKELRSSGRTDEELLSHATLRALKSLPDTLDSAQVGSWYESSLHCRLAREKNQLRIVFEGGRARSSGAYYTPKFICRYVVETTLGPLVRGRSVEEILLLRVCDPAMGAGNFLVEALEYLAEQLEQRGYLQNKKLSSSERASSIRHEVFRNCIYGIDLDSTTVKVAQICLALALGLSPRDSESLAQNLVCGDGLIDDPKISARALNLLKTFPFLATRGFDCVVGNPPFIETRLINPDERAHLFDKFETLKSKANYYVCFFERAISGLLRGNPTGRLALVTPPGWMSDNPSYKAFKNFLISRSRLLEVCDLDPNVFPVPTSAFFFDLSSKKKSGVTVKRTRLIETPSGGCALPALAKSMSMQSTIGLDEIAATDKETTLGAEFEFDAGLSFPTEANEQCFDGKDRFLGRGLRDKIAITHEDWVSGYNYDKIVKLKRPADRVRDRETFESEKLILVRRPYVVVYDDQKVFCKSNCILIRCKKGGFANLKYMALLLNSTRYRQLIEERISTSQGSIDLLMRIPFQVPSPVVLKKAEALFEKIRPLGFAAQIQAIDGFFSSSRFSNG